MYPLLIILYSLLPQQQPTPYYLHQLAIFLEIIDYRVTTSTPHYITNNLIILAKHNAPPSYDYLRFLTTINEESHYQVASTLCHHNRIWLKSQEEALRSRNAPLHILPTITLEANHRLLIWTTYCESASLHYYIHVRRLALARLRDLLGPDNYAKGVLPSHIPLQYVVVP